MTTESLRLHNSTKNILHYIFGFFGTDQPCRIEQQLRIALTKDGLIGVIKFLVHII